MIRPKQIFSLLLAGSMIVGMTGFDVYAAAKKKINSMNMKIEANIEPGTDYGEEDIEVNVKTKNCTFLDYEILNDDNEWDLNTVPKIQIMIEAEDGYVFNISSLSKISVSGGELVTASRADSNTLLKVTVTLSGLDNYVGEMTTVHLNHDGIATWDPAIGATSYYVRLYRDGSAAGAAVTTTKTKYDFSPAMLRSGNYSVKVRATNNISEKTSTVLDSSSVFITDEKAGWNKENNSSKPGEWRMDAVGWWYPHLDDTYTVSGWEQIGGSWFAFDSSGYMRTGWVELEGKTYYFNPENGAMLTNTTIDGYVLGEDGARIQ